MGTEEAQPTGFRHKDWKEEERLNAQISDLGTCVDGGTTHCDGTEEERSR